MKKDTIILIVLLAALIIGGTLLAAPQRRTESMISTTYNSDSMGVKAFYTLLTQMGYNVGRLTRPYTEMTSRAKLLIVVQPSKNMDNNSFSKSVIGPGISDDERKHLTDWVRRGGTAIVMAENLDGVPATFGSTYKLDKGYVYASPSRKKITNKGMRNPKNAVELVGIINKHIKKGELILFDEYHHGVIDSKPFCSHIRRQAWIAIGIIFFAGILLIYSKGRRFGAVRSLPLAENVRPGYEYVESVARLYQRAHASDLAARILCDSFRQGLCAKLGVSADDKTDRIVYRLSEEVNSKTADRARELFAQMLAGERLTEEELVDISGEVHELEKELGIAN